MKLAANVGTHVVAQVKIRELVVLSRRVHAPVKRALKKPVVLAQGRPVLCVLDAIRFVIFAVKAQGVAILQAAPDALNTVVQLVGIGVATLHLQCEADLARPAIALAKLPGLRIGDCELGQRVCSDRRAVSRQQQCFPLDAQRGLFNNCTVGELEHNRLTTTQALNLILLHLERTGKFGVYRHHAVAHAGHGAQDA